MSRHKSRRRLAAPPSACQDRAGARGSEPETHPAWSFIPSLRAPLTMADKPPPERPRLAWVDSWATPIEESSDFLEVKQEEEEEEVVPLPGPFDDLAVYQEEEEAVTTIDAFVTNKQKSHLSEEQKMKFLESVCSVCTTAREKGLSAGLDCFCRRTDVARHIEIVLASEPQDQLQSPVREQAMLAVAALSTVQVIKVREMLRLLDTCFQSVFLLPPKEKLNARFYVMALMRFCTSANALARRRAMERVCKLGEFLAKCSSLEPFGRYLKISQRTDLILTCLQLVTEGVCDEDQHWVSFLLDATTRDPISWLADVPHFVNFFFKTLKKQPAPDVRKRLLELLVLLTECFPRSVLMTVLFICPSQESASMDMWEVMFAVPAMAKRLLHELHLLLHDRNIREFLGVAEDLSLVRLSLLYAQRPEDPVPKELRDVECLQRCLRTANFHLLWLALKGLAALMERPQLAKAGQCLLPDVLETLQFGKPHITAAALAVCGNILGIVEKKAASLTALELVDVVKPLLDNEAAAVRESSMKLFKAAMERVLWRHKTQMWKKVRKILVPLYLRMSDETHSVAKASQEALMAAAELLWWDELKDVAHMEQTWRIRACLLQQDRDRVEKRLQQSRAYLEDPQASVREETVRFIGLAAELLQDQSEEKLREIIDILQPMMHDAAPSVRAETSRTIQALLQHRKWLQRLPVPWNPLAALCCWPRRRRQRPKTEPQPEESPEGSGSEGTSKDPSPCQSKDD
ncbi:uncharacterized protein [Anser cygnoides]|uniref:uncharacterized protein isoform X2 n=1 Tax=Anser cygnoides TaxID=8845 RepID=UPI0034D2ED97